MGRRSQRLRAPFLGEVMEFGRSYSSEVLHVVFRRFAVNLQLRTPFKLRSQFITPSLVLQRCGKVFFRFLILHIYDRFCVCETYLRENLQGCKPFLRYSYC